MSLKPRRVNFDNVWNGIQDTIHGVMTLSNIPKNVWSDRFLDIYVICTAIPDPLCEELYQATNAFLRSHVQDINMKLHAISNELFLTMYHKHWTDYSRGALYLNLLYSYLNAQYIRKQKYKEADIKYGRMFVDMLGSPNNHHVAAMNDSQNSFDISSHNNLYADVGAGPSNPVYYNTSPTNLMLLEIGDLALSIWKSYVIEPNAYRIMSLLMTAILAERQKCDNFTANFNQANTLDTSLVPKTLDDSLQNDNKTNAIINNNNNCINDLTSIKNNNNLAKSGNSVPNIEEKERNALFSIPHMHNNHINLGKNSHLNGVTYDQKLIPNICYNLTLLSEVIQSLVEVERNTKYPKRLYKSVFEDAYLTETSNYYKQYSQHLLNEEKLNCPQYMQQVVAKLSEEGRRNRSLVDHSTLPKVELVCQKRLVTDVLPFLHTEARDMIRDELIKDLHLMYTLLNPIDDSLKALMDTLCQHITEVLMAQMIAMEEQNDPVSYVETILSTHQKFKQFIAITFDNDNRFLLALDRACTNAINYKSPGKQFCRAPEQLSRYCDILLKKNPRSMSETDIEINLSNVVTLFKYLQDKDTFQQFYANMLAKRLIFGSSQSLDTEENMINKLKQACGFDFTSKLTRMFTDIRISKDLNEKFFQSLKLNNNENDGGIPISNFSVYILQAGSWPINQSNLPSFQAPQILEKCLNQFEQFYGTNFKKRNLTWLFHLSMGELKLTYLAKPYFLSLNTYQMAILLLFNEDSYDINIKNNKNHAKNLNSDNKGCSSPYITYDTIQSVTTLANAELKRHLLTFLDFGVLDMYKINTIDNTLEIVPSTKSILLMSNPGTTSTILDQSKIAMIEHICCQMECGVFALNHNFSNKKTKIKLPILPPNLPAHIFTQNTGNNAVNIGTSDTLMIGINDSDATNYAIEEDRKLFLQTVIVRILKSRKSIHHNNLIPEVIEHSKHRFLPSVPMIKKCVEGLIEKQFMKRRGDEYPDEYIYLA